MSKQSFLNSLDSHFHTIASLKKEKNVAQSFFEHDRSDENESDLHLVQAELDEAYDNLTDFMNDCQDKLETWLLYPSEGERLVELTVLLLQNQLTQNEREELENACLKFYAEGN